MDEHLRDLLRQRQEARAAKDFARADAIRDEIAAAGFVVRDTPEGAVLESAQRFERVAPAAIANTLSNEPTIDFSIHLLHEGYLEDVQRFLKGFRAHNDTARAEIVIVDNASNDGEALEDMRTDGVRVLHLDAESGWATARNAGLKTSAGRTIVLADLSIQPAGDLLGPLTKAFEDPSVGAAGPFGLVSDDMRSWRESPGPEVDALEGYLLATRREILARDLLHERFKWYRNADIDLSFQIRAAGYQAVAVDVPVVKHVHRGWDSLDEDERAKRSKRNHYLFFDRWKAREDLLLANRGR